uniref:Uncharacterized protein n=1 Tax=Molossus molossus TaxID=27622 RepID=A0A7J8I8Y4_MOLMO|nr:hypothetical protein HJG59_010606 [Molossus molossus]
MTQDSGYWADSLTAEPNQSGQPSSFSWRLVFRNQALSAGCAHCLERPSQLSVRFVYLLRHLLLYLFPCIYTDNHEQDGANSNCSINVNNSLSALAGLAQRLECWPVVCRDPGSVPAKGTYLGCSLSLALVGLCGWQPLDVPFLSLSPSHSI